MQSHIHDKSNSDWQIAHFKGIKLREKAILCSTLHPHALSMLKGVDRAEVLKPQ